MEKLTYASMIQVDTMSEFHKVVDGKRCQTTETQKQFVIEQVTKICGWDEKTSIAISPLGVVFMSSEGEVSNIGRVDADFNFYEKL